MANLNKRLSVHSDRIERWLGADKIAELSANLKGWYGPPINVMDLPGSVWIGADGDFVGDFDRGFFDSAKDSFERFAKRFWKAAGRPESLAVGFTSLADAVGRASAGYATILQFSKTGVAGTTGAAASLWTAAGQPSAGAIGSAAPGGRATDKSTTGAMPFSNPASGTNHLIGADMQTSVVGSLLIYDRIFDVAVNMNSSSAQSVTGVPTRYQSTTVTAMDYCGGNFFFPEVIGVLAATGHNWDAMLYRNQAGTDSQAAPVMAGISAAAAARLDMPLGTWFTPLNTGDIGVKDIDSMKLSTTVATGTADWVVGHPIGIMSLPVANTSLPFDWLTNRQLAPRIFDDACLAALELPKTSGTAGTYSGLIQICNAAP